jgi:hypothetical protein
MSLLKNIFSKKEVPVKTYEDFWKLFQKNEKTFFKVVKDENNIEENFFKKLSGKLDEIKDGFYYLTGMFDDNTAELVLTADGNLNNIIFIEEIINAAPAINNWKLTAHKPALDINDVSIRMDGFSFSDENLNFYSNDDFEYPDEINISVVHDDYSDENSDIIKRGTFIFLDNYLGELNYATTVDSTFVIGKTEAQKELIPIEKLKSYLVWREKEFVEKYDNVVPDVEEAFLVYEGKMNDGSYYIGTLNSNLLAWEYKASHPWFVLIKLEFDSENGLPDDAMAEKLNHFEDNLLELLTSQNGNLYLGRETNNGEREIYFACRDFRNASKVLYQTQKNHLLTKDFTYEIYKDKYWSTLKHYMG